MKNEIISPPSFREKHSRAIRIWHWSSFIIILGSLLTVLLSETLLDMRENIHSVKTALEEKGVVLTLDQAKSVARINRHIIWDWHIYFGYVLAALFFYRVILEFFQPKGQKIFGILKNAKKYLKAENSDKKTAKQYLFSRYIYLIYYLTLGIMSCTGLFMAFADGNENLDEIRHNLKEIHGVGMYVILSFIVVHLGGIIAAESSKKYKGVVSDMFNGGE
jgi:Ni/Fe-hydrogenase 1 B-type cytochrome subunit